METPITMDDLGVRTPYFWKHPISYHLAQTTK